ncbi:hypothetical protein HDU91_001547, partial [Kappamyces sp. JEL0680]
MLSFAAFALVNAVSAALAYGPCDKTKFGQAANINVSYPIVSALQSGDIPIKGDFYIIDGCNFGLRNFVFYNARETYLYGAMPGSNEAMTLTDQTVIASAFPMTQTFSLKQDAGSQANFDAFTEIRFFEVTTKTVIATVSLPALPAGASSSGSSGSS